MHIRMDLGLCSSFSTAISTPAEQLLFPKNSSGSPPAGTLNPAAVVGILLYLCGHMCPNIAAVVFQCDRHTFCPTRHHELVLIWGGLYLKGMMDKGLITLPSDIPCEDIAILKQTLPVCMVMRISKILTVPVAVLVFLSLFSTVSKFQTEIALSIMDPQYVALSTACKDLFHIVDLIC
ncbi:hypothetical protein ACHAW6_005600 [Cyclotella cf. meneghiniana]